MMTNEPADRRWIERAGRLGRWWPVMLGAAGACALGALAFSLHLSPVYRATTYILVSESKIGEVSRDANLQQMAMLPTFVPFLDNDALIDESLRRLHLDEPPYALTVDVFRRRHLDVRVPRSTRLLELSIEFPEAELAARLANELAQGAVRFNDRLNETDTRTSQQFLRGRLEEAAHRMAEAAARRVGVLAEARIEDRERDLALLLSEKEALHARLQRLRLDLAENEVRSESLEQALAAEPETIRLTKSITSDPFLARAAEGLNPAGTPLAVTEESVNELRQSLRQDAIDAAVGAAVQEAGVAAAAARLEQVNRDVPERLQLLVTLRSRIAAAEQDYAMAAAALSHASLQYETASLTVSAKSQDMKQIAPALVPERPVRPQILVNTVLGLLLGALASGAAAAAIESHRDLQRRP